jgi:hypothetical protein
VRFRDQYETQGQHGTQNLGKAVGNAVGKAVGKGTSEAQKKRSAALVGVRVSCKELVPGERCCDFSSRQASARLLTD